MDMERELMARYSAHIAAELEMEGDFLNAERVWWEAYWSTDYGADQYEWRGKRYKFCRGRLERESSTYRKK